MFLFTGLFNGFKHITKLRIEHINLCEVSCHRLTGFSIIDKVRWQNQFICFKLCSIANSPWPMRQSTANKQTKGLIIIAAHKLNYSVHIIVCCYFNTVGFKSIHYFKRVNRLWPNMCFAGKPYPVTQILQVVCNTFYSFFCRSVVFINSVMHRIHARIYGSPDGATHRFGCTHLIEFYTRFGKPVDIGSFNIQPAITAQLISGQIVGNKNQYISFWRILFLEIRAVTNSRQYKHY